MPYGIKEGRLRTNSDGQFFLAYKSLCPSSWTERWDDQRGEYLARETRAMFTDAESQMPEPSQPVWISRMFSHSQAKETRDRDNVVSMGVGQREGPVLHKPVYYTSTTDRKATF